MPFPKLCNSLVSSHHSIISTSIPVFWFGKSNPHFIVNKLPSAFNSFRETSLWKSGPVLKTPLSSWPLLPSWRKGSILPQDGHLRVRTRGGSAYSSESLKHPPRFLCCQHQVKAFSLLSRPLTCDYTSFPCSPPLGPVTRLLSTCLTFSWPLISFTHFSCPLSGPHFGPIHPRGLCPLQLPIHSVP